MTTKEICWFSPVLNDVVTATKIKHGYRLQSMSSEVGATIARSELQNYKLEPLPDGDLELALLRVAGESRSFGNLDSTMAAIAVAVDADDFVAAGALARTVPSTKEALFVRSKYLTEERLLKIRKHSLEVRNERKQQHTTVRNMFDFP